jgi:hypothetical protein
MGNASLSFAEEVLTKNFRVCENGPPLAVEPLPKTKERLHSC